MSLRRCIEESPQQYGLKKSTFTGTHASEKSPFTDALIAARNLRTSAILARERQRTA